MAEEKKKIRRIQDSELLRAKKAITLEEIKRIYQPPVTHSGAPEMAQDSSLDPFYDTVYGSLTQHAYAEGQLPMTGFVGYGVLQQISQNSIIRACIKTIADEATREWIEITGGDTNDDGTINEEEAEKVKNISDLCESKYHLKQLFTRALATVGFMGGAFIYIDTGAEDPSVPLTISKFSDEFGKDKDVKFTLIDPVNCSPAEVNQFDPLKQDYMRPKAWWVLGKRVHSSRLITLIENEPTTLLKPAYNYLGIPRAQLLWDYVLHFNKARSTTVELLEKLNLTVFKTNVSDLLSTAGGLEELDARMGGLSRFRNNSSVMVVDQTEESIENVSITLTGATDITRQALELVACANRTPIVKTLGLSPNGFSTGETDLANFYDHLRSVQELYRDQILECLKVVQLAEYGEIDPSVTFDFCALGKDDKVAETQSASTRAQTLLSLQGQNVISAEEVREAVRNDDTMGLSFIGEELPEQPQQGMEGMGGMGGLEGMLGAQGAEGAPQQGQPPQEPQTDFEAKNGGLNALLEEIKAPSEKEPQEDSAPEANNGVELAKALVAEIKEGKDEQISNEHPAQLGIG